MRLALKEKENENLGVFTIHSFGFGKDHDEDLMNKISQLKDGSFYYIKELNTLDEAFCNALGSSNHSQMRVERNRFRHKNKQGLWR